MSVEVEVIVELALAASAGEALVSGVRRRKRVAVRKVRRRMLVVEVEGKACFELFVVKRTCRVLLTRC